MKNILVKFEKGAFSFETTTQPADISDLEPFVNACFLGVDSSIVLDDIDNAIYALQDGDLLGRWFREEHQDTLENLHSFLRYNYGAIKLQRTLAK